MSEKENICISLIKKGWKGEFGARFYGDHMFKYQLQEVYIQHKTLNMRDKITAEIYNIFFTVVYYLYIICFVFGNQINKF